MSFIGLSRIHLRNDTVDRHLVVGIQYVCRHLKVMPLVLKFPLNIVQPWHWLKTCDIMEDSVVRRNIFKCVR